VGSALATDAASTSSATPPDPKAFITLASQDNMTEVQLGELAMRNTRNPNVHRFAQRMINDHGKANTELVGIAQQRNLIVAKELDPEHTALVQDLSSKNGPEFDAAYAKTMEDAHAKAINLLRLCLGSMWAPPADSSKVRMHDEKVDDPAHKYF